MTKTLGGHAFEFVDDEVLSCRACPRLCTVLVDGRCWTCAAVLCVPDRDVVFIAARGGRATREIVAATGLSKDRVVESLEALVAAGLLVGVPRPAPWFVFWAWAERRMSC